MISNVLSLEMVENLFILLFHCLNNVTSLLPACRLTVGMWFILHNAWMHSALNWYFMFLKKGQNGVLFIWPV